MLHVFALSLHLVVFSMFFLFVGKGWGSSWSSQADAGPCEGTAGPFKLAGRLEMAEALEASSCVELLGERMTKRSLHQSTDDQQIHIVNLIVELRTPTPVGVGGGKERGGCHLNLRT